MSISPIDVHSGLADESDAMRWRRTFPGRTDQSRPARHFVAFLLAGCPLADDAVSVTGELVANALTHTHSAKPGGLFVVEVRRWRGGAAVAVTDQGGTSEPRIREAGWLAESGRGLHCQSPESVETVLCHFGPELGG
ncbi:ATP-binding protein [Actinoallomurus sp. NPDC052274]|uniref:ATP-binding protein n=1 Tax=Actinoallomurus sp. NPDC052274 TaxID=3155420 RepID=UPI003426AF52